MREKHVMWIPKELITALAEANARSDEDDVEEFPKRVKNKQSKRVFLQLPPALDADLFLL